MVSSNKQCQLEMLRALGSLIYENGANLNLPNTQALFGKCDHYRGSISSSSSSNGKKDPIEAGILLLGIDHSLFLSTDPINEYTLMWTQIVFNLTLPVTVISYFYFILISYGM